MFREKGIQEGILVSISLSSSVLPAVHQSKMWPDHTIPQTTRITPLTLHCSSYSPNHRGSDWISGLKISFQ